MVKLSVEKVRDKIRYKKMHKGQRWKSGVYHADTRANRREAAAAFESWRDSSSPQQEVLTKLLDASSATSQGLMAQLAEALADGEKLTENLQSYIDHKDNPDALKEIAGDIGGQTLKRWYDDYITFKSTLAAADERSPKTVSTIKSHLPHFIRFAGEHLKIGKVDADLWQQFFLDLAGRKSQRDPTKPLSGTSKSQYQSAARTFLKWCSRQQGCDLEHLPKNLDDAELRFSKVPTKKMDEIIWQPADLKKALKILPDHWRCWLLLMLNCGFTQTDLNSLTREEIAKGRIIRRREKTRRQPNPPVVNYKLWKETQTALTIELERCTDETFALMTEKGARLTPVLEKQNDVGDMDVSTFDNVSRNWTQQRDKEENQKKGLTQKTLEGLRKAGSDTIKDYGETGIILRDIYLGHSTTIADKHYDSKSGRPYKPLDKAIADLGKKFGLK